MSSEETVVVETSEAEETHGAQGCNIPQWFSSLCHRAGMAETAPAAWCRIYTQPDVICLCCLVANCVAPTLNTSLLYFASGPLRWTLHPFAVVYSVSHYTVLALTWRMGPDGALRPLSKVCMLAAISIYIPLVLVLLLGPESQCPFRSRLIFTFINSFSMWTWTFAAVCGNWAMDHPEKPYRCTSRRILTLTQVHTPCALAAQAVASSPMQIRSVDLLIHIHGWSVGNCDLCKAASLLPSL